MRVCVCRECHLYCADVYFPRTVFLPHYASLQEGYVHIDQNVYHIVITDPIVRCSGKCLQGLGLVTLVTGVLVMVACTIATVLEYV